MVHIFEFFSGLRAFHVFSNIANWKPYIGQKICFKWKHNSTYDILAVAGKTLLKGRIVAVFFHHIPRGFSQYTWCSTQKGANFEATTDDTKAKASPLIQGRLDI